MNLQNNKPVISIALATYNGESYLRQQVDSILAQSYTNWRLWIRDDGSTDSTIDIIKSYAKEYPEKIIIVDNEGGNLGVTLNFSEIVEHISSDYVMFSDQDDVWSPDKILKTFKRMRQLESEYGGSTPLLVFSDLKVVGSNLEEYSDSMWNFQKLDPEIAKNLYQILAQNVVTGSTIMINTAARARCFPIPTGNVLHDHWMAMNVCKYGVNDFIAEPLVQYRQYGYNELGAINVNPRYFFMKSVQNIFNFKSYIDKYRCLSFKVSFTRIFIMKLYISIKRMLTNRA